MKQITEEQIILADKIFWLLMEYVNEDEYITVNDEDETHNTEKGEELYYEIENLLTQN